MVRDVAILVALGKSYADKLKVHWFAVLEEDGYDEYQGRGYTYCHTSVG